MATITTTAPLSKPFTRTPTFADIQNQLQVPTHRILVSPNLGTATVDDVIAIHERENRLCELVDGVLVEKTMGFQESRLALVLGYLLELYLEDHDLGMVLGADGMLRLNPTLVRIPDISFISWEQLPGRQYPEEKVPSLYPDLAVEVLSASNTTAEMDQKLRDYFDAGARLVWYLDPVDRSARVYTAPDSMTHLEESDTLEGGDLLPGFRLVIADWFTRAMRPGRNH
jgi:Uma2 family endonuclease